jgi:hypothetical protein
MTDKISPFEALDFIRDNAKTIAEARKNVIYLTEYRKSLKSLLMNECKGLSQSASESYAYAHESYIQHLQVLADAVYEAERLRWLMVGAEAKIEVWRSLESSARAEGKATQ